MIGGLNTNLYSYMYKSGQSGVDSLSYQLYNPANQWGAGLIDFSGYSLIVDSVASVDTVAQSERSEESSGFLDCVVSGAKSLASSFSDNPFGFIASSYDSVISGLSSAISSVKSKVSSVSSSVSSTISSVVDQVETTVSHYCGKATSIVQRALEVARRELARGVHETSKNDSADIRRYKKGSKNNLPWCAYFTSYCFSIGQDRSNSETFGYTASSQAIRRAAEKANHFAKKNSGYTPIPGDVAIWTNVGDSSHGHVGIVSEVDTQKGIIKIIEGNSGDAVRENTYSISKLYAQARFNGFCKMNEWTA